MIHENRRIVAITTDTIELAVLALDETCKKALQQGQEVSS